MLLDATQFDRLVRAWVLAHQSHGIYLVFYWISAVCSVTPMAGYGAIGALLLWRRGRWQSASIILLAPAAAVVTYLGIKRLVGRPRPSLAGLLEGTSSFPSAHATTSAAVCLTLAYAFRKEGEIGGASAAVVGIVVPLLVGASRVYLDLHWTTDVLGGWAAGLLIALIIALLGGVVDRRSSGGPRQNSSHLKLNA